MVESGLDTMVMMIPEHTLTIQMRQYFRKLGGSRVQ